MPDISIIQLLPDQPMSAADFTNALNGLIIRAFDVSFGTLEGAFVGEARFLPSDPTQSRIAQNYIDIVPDNVPVVGDIDIPVFWSVATAIIEIENNSPEYGIESPDGNILYSVDLRLEIERNDREILSPRIYYNCPVITINTVPDPVTPIPGIDTFPPDPYAVLTPIAIYLNIPEAGHELDPDVAFIDLSQEGPPPFSDLLNAITRVLEQDPGGTIDPEFLANLTPQQCLHLANEIVCNPVLNPPPELPIDQLRELYTGPNDDSEEAAAIEGRRLRFEGEIKQYEAECKAKADRLASFIFALSSAINSERLSRDADRVGFSFPIHSELPDTPGKIKGAEVILTGTGSGLEPAFVGPAPDWYALGASSPLQITKEQRHQSAILAPEEQLLTQLRQAIEAGVITATATALSGTETATAEHAARRLAALGQGTGTGTECPLDADSPEHDLVEAWLAFSGEDIAAFWTDAVQDHAQGHLNLVLCAVTENHAQLISAIRDDLGITNVEALAALSTGDWRAFFESNGVPPATDLLPSFTQGSPEQRVEAFIRHARKFFNVAVAVESPDDPTMSAAPALPKPLFDPFTRFVEAYNNPAALPAPDEDFAFGSELDELRVRVATEAVFPDDENAQAWLNQAIVSINDLYRVTDIGLPDTLRYACMEALWSKAFYSMTR